MRVSCLFEHSAMGSRGLVAGAAFAAVGLFIASVRRVSTVSVPVASKLAGGVPVSLLDGGTGEELIRQVCIYYGHADIWTHPHTHTHTHTHTTRVYRTTVTFGVQWRW